MVSLSRFVGVLSVASAAIVAGSAHGTVLTFDFTGSDGTGVPQLYGDRVTNFNNTSLGFQYGSAGGITPNVTVFYKDFLRLGGTNPNDPQATRVFGNLTNVLYRDRQQGGIQPGIMQIELSADPGFEVCLHYFDLAAVFNRAFSTGEDLRIKSVEVINLISGQVLYSVFNDAPPTLIPGTPPPGTPLPISSPSVLRSLRYDFDANPLRAPVLAIKVDATLLQSTIFGSKVDRVGIDNIKFSQIPTPAAGMLALLGGGIVATRRRRA